jgi:hypothetical protein
MWMICIGFIVSICRFPKVGSTFKSSKLDNFSIETNWNPSFSGSSILKNPPIWSQWCGSSGLAARQVPLVFYKAWVPAVKAHAKSLGKKSFGILVMEGNSGYGVFVQNNLGICFMVNDHWNLWLVTDADADWTTSYTYKSIVIVY